MTYEKHESALVQREALREKLRIAEYRRSYASAALYENISLQVRALRRQRGLSQEELGTLAKTKQPKISNIETPSEGERAPNWELDTLDRVGFALGTRVKVSFETYGSLIEEGEAMTTESLRRPLPEHDSALFVPPKRPGPDSGAPERTQWMQEAMIPYLWEDRLDRSTLLGWLQGRRLPPVGHDEPAYLWLLRGIPREADKLAKRFLEMRLAEMLSIVLGEQPDVEPLVVDQDDDFLINLYRTCAGLDRPGYLGRELWAHYQRLHLTKPSGAVRDALEAALIVNQVDDKALEKIWKPMVETGKHPRTRKLRGGEVAGYEGIVSLCRVKKVDIDVAFWALNVISHRWEGTPGQRADFLRLMDKLLALKEAMGTWRLTAAARTWSAWAQSLVPRVEVDMQLPKVTVAFSPGRLAASWLSGEGPRMKITGFSTLPESEMPLQLTGKPNATRLINIVQTYIGNLCEPDSYEMDSELKTQCLIAHASVGRQLIEARGN